MRRIQVVIDAELDDRLEREAASRHLSKSALVRVAVEHELSEPYENALARIGALSALFADVESVDDVDEYLYGSLGQEA